MRDKCAKNPSIDDCTRLKQQMEDLLRKCKDMTTPVSACVDVRTKYCFMWSKELFCYTSITGNSASGNQVLFAARVWFSQSNMSCLR
jgi:hypothetical protein